MKSGSIFSLRRRRTRQRHPDQPVLAAAPAVLTPDVPQSSSALSDVEPSPVLLDELGRVLGPASAGSPLIVYPGLARDGFALRPLLRLGRRLGYASQDWGRGVNLGPTAPIEPFVQQLALDVRMQAERSGQPVTLLGCSLGAVYAREVARQIPDAVKHVIAIGSAVPLVRDAFGVRWLLAWAARLGPGEVRRLLVRLRRPLAAPLTCLQATEDGCVARLPGFAW